MIIEFHLSPQFEKLHNRRVAVFAPRYKFGDTKISDSSFYNRTLDIILCYRQMKSCACLIKTVAVEQGTLKRKRIGNDAKNKE